MDVLLVEYFVLLGMFNNDFFVYFIIMVRVRIDLDKFVCRWLKSISVVPAESYESILVRLLDCKLGCNVCEYSVFDEDLWVSVNLLVDWDSVDSNLMFSLRSDYSNEFPINTCVDYETWNHFKEKVLGIDDIFSILAILDCGETINFNDLLFRRIK